MATDPIAIPSAPVDTLPTHKKVPYHRAKHLIVDIETMGITIPSPILSVGAVYLDFTVTPHVVRPVFFKMDPKESVGSPDTETILWWLHQSEAARNEAFFSPVTEHAYDRLEAFMSEMKPDYYWGKSPDFDFGHLAAQFKAQGRTIPWKFWQLRDIRTMEGLGLTGYESDDPVWQDLKLTAETAKTGAHCALMDAFVEAKVLYETILILKTLKDCFPGYAAEKKYPEGA